MKFQKQKFLHKPDEGIFGDCIRTCLAILMDLDAEDVPHFFATGTFDQDAYDAWLRDNGLHVITVTFPGETPQENVMFTADRMGGGLPYMLSGHSRTPSNHVVVAQGNEIVCDPSLTDSGIVGPMKNPDGSTVWWIEWLVRKL